MKPNAYPHIETKADFAAYESAVASFFKREGIENLSRIESEAEPYFSWRSCECCGRSLGGDRSDCHGYNPTTKEIVGPFSICQDCEYYVEYGQLDDMTMLEIDKE